MQYKQNYQNLMQSKLNKYFRKRLKINPKSIKIKMKIESQNYLKNKKNNNMNKANNKLNKIMPKNYLVIKDVAILVMTGLE